VLLRQENNGRVSAETAGLWLHREQIVWRRPRPVLGPKAPDYAYKLGKIRHLLATLPDEETVVFEDEVNILTVSTRPGSYQM